MSLILDKFACWGPATLPKISSSKFFKGFCSDLQYFKISQYFRNIYFLEHLLVAASNRYKISKYSFPQKLCIQDKKLGGEKA